MNWLACVLLALTPQARFEAALERSDWPENEHAAVMAVAHCESGGTYRADLVGDLHLPRRTDGMGSIGPMQINGGNLYGRNVHSALRHIEVDNLSRAAVRAWLSDLDNNLAAAHAIWLRSGWQEWTCKP